MNTTIKAERERLLGELSKLHTTCMEDQGHDFQFCDICSIEPGTGGNRRDIIIGFGFSCVDCGLQVKTTFRSYGFDRRLDDSELRTYVQGLVKKMQENDAENPHLVFHPFQRSGLPYRFSREDLSPSFTAEQEEKSLAKAVARQKAAARLKLKEEHQRALARLE